MGKITFRPSQSYDVFLDEKYVGEAFKNSEGSWCFAFKGWLPISRKEREEIDKEISIMNRAESAS